MASSSSSSSSAAAAAATLSPAALVGPIDESSLHPDLRVRGVRSLYVVGELLLSPCVCLCV
jgi:hypothetical protein